MLADHRRVPDLRVSVMDNEVEAISPNSLEKVSYHLAKSHGYRNLHTERREQGLWLLFIKRWDLRPVLRGAVVGHPRPHGSPGGWPEVKWKTDRQLCHAERAGV